MRKEYGRGIALVLLLGACVVPSRPARKFKPRQGLIAQVGTQHVTHAQVFVGYSVGHPVGVLHLQVIAVAPVLQVDATLLAVGLEVTQLRKVFATWEEVHCRQRIEILPLCHKVAVVAPHHVEGDVGRELFLKERGRIAERRSEEHTSELQSRQYLVCRLLLEKKETTLSSRLA